VQERERASEELHKLDIDIALITSVENATYLCGFEVPLHAGPIDCIGKGMPLVTAVFVAGSKEIVLIACEEYRAMIEAA